ncbi:hypothetical protein [Pseudobacteriovorax antillogorgiicola]|uniref:Uncharacterized protein n=1 Tax=Pseudobacteriovorax antillogorgiicola TaxID=1513793 RepID=A0A1Y6B6H8_9BACT|nr:hypothetical protein [Pseudobacteriovorax antillogorgiicola]TCS59201.1 hypothetical protein EDD56_101104 [Pseudobacteriovorax antillogorgiicola]SME90640.1 hypothetical protein SAMN06296036_101382 [Pseudobacteriovorax antillogorgiicola]
MRITYLYVALLLAEVSQAKSLPPVGKRVYIIEDEALYAPVTIKGEQKPLRRRGVLRDPIPLGEAGLTRRREIEFRDPGMEPRKESQLKFSSLAIKGRIASPRVQFQLEPLDLYRADQELNIPLKTRLFRQASQQEHHARKSSR